MTAVHDAYLEECVNHSDIYIHLPVLFAAASTAQTVIEIGVGSFRSTSALMAGVEVSGGQLWSVEIDTRPSPDWLEGHAQWTLTEGDSLAVVDQAPENVDLLFIDSEHTYDQTFAELEAYVPRVRSGGVVLLHDTETSHARVKDALNDWCPAHGLTWTNTPECYGLGRIDIP
jgi:predicted O-methyltransferase YrrM